MHTVKNVLIQVHPQVRLPRTFRRFCGLIVQLLQKLSIRATNGPDKLLKVCTICFVTACSSLASSVYLAPPACILASSSTPQEALASFSILQASASNWIMQIMCDHPLQSREHLASWCR